MWWGKGFKTKLSVRSSNILVGKTTLLVLIILRVMYPQKVEKSDNYFVTILMKCVQRTYIWWMLADVTELEPGYRNESFLTLQP